MIQCYLICLVSTSNSLKLCGCDHAVPLSTSPSPPLPPPGCTHLFSSIGKHPAHRYCPGPNISPQACALQLHLEMPHLFGAFIETGSSERPLDPFPSSFSFGLVLFCPLSFLQLFIQPLFLCPPDVTKGQKVPAGESESSLADCCKIAVSGDLMRNKDIGEIQLLLSTFVTCSTLFFPSRHHCFLFSTLFCRLILKLEQKKNKSWILSFYSSVRRAFCSLFLVTIWIIAIILNEAPYFSFFIITLFPGLYLPGRGFGVLLQDICSKRPSFRTEELRAYEG